MLPFKIIASNALVSRICQQFYSVNPNDDRPVGQLTSGRGPINSEPDSLLDPPLNIRFRTTHRANQDSALPWFIRLRPKADKPTSTTHVGFYGISDLYHSASPLPVNAITMSDRGYFCQNAIRIVLAFWLIGGGTAFAQSCLIDSSRYNLTVDTRQLVNENHAWAHLVLAACALAMSTLKASSSSRRRAPVRLYCEVRDFPTPPRRTSVERTLSLLAVFGAINKRRGIPPCTYQFPLSTHLAS